MAKVMDSFGFDSATFDSATSSTILPSSLRKKVHDALPPSWSSQWKYFYEGQTSFFLYSAVFVSGMYVQFIRDDKSVSSYNYRLKLASTIFVPWAWSGIIGIGHEAAHSAIAPSRTFLGKILNFVYTYTLLPLTICGIKTWNQQHNINHHKTVNQSVDLQALRGNNPIEEALYGFYGFLKHTYYDFVEIFSINTSLIERVWTSLGIVTRLYLLFGAYKKRGAYVIGLNIYFLTFFQNYFVFLSHSQPTRSKDEIDDYFTLQLRETWDIRPQSRLSQFFHFGFGAHASHHTFGYLPRSLLPNVAQVLKENCKDEYKEINSIYDEFRLFWNRHQRM